MLSDRRPARPSSSLLFAQAVSNRVSSHEDLDQTKLSSSFDSCACYPSPSPGPYSLGRSKQASKSWEGPATTQARASELSASISRTKRRHSTCDSTLRETRPLPPRTPARSPTWSYQPQRGFESEDLQHWRMCMAGSSRIGPLTWTESRPLAARTRPPNAESDAHMREGHASRRRMRPSIFSRELQYDRHIFFFYLVVLLAVICRLALGPSKLASERLARAKGMAL